MALHPLAAGFLAGCLPPMAPGYLAPALPVRRDRHGDIVSDPALPEQTLAAHEAAAVRASILGSPATADDEPRAEPVAYGPMVKRQVDGLEVRARLSEVHRQYPDHMEARRRARAGVPLIGWPPRAIYALDA